MNPTLIIIDSMGCIIREDLNRFRKDVIAFGRSEQRNDIVVSDGFISGNHGVFIRQNGRFYYRDTGSLNGSYILSGPEERNLKDTAEVVELRNNSIIRIAY